MANDSRKDQIRKAQQAYSQADLTGDSSDWDTYYALVQQVAWSHGIDLAQAYVLVEEGPVITN